MAMTQLFGKVFAIVFCAAVVAAEPQSAPDTAPLLPDERQVELGKRMYREGRLPSGQPMRAMVQHDIPLPGTQVACIGCHRRSGLSSSEGQVFVPPISGDILYRPREISRKQMYASRSEGPGTRPAYTDKTLARAIRDGIDPAGRTLDTLMPRYSLSDANLTLLLTYLKSLSSAPSPGVTDATVHFATVITEGADPEQRAAMLAVLQAYLQSKNAETRHETRRAKHAPWYKDVKYEAYRKWELHVWDLTGPAHTWPAQLETYYRQQPVFAVLSGLGAGTWRPIHEFCENYEIPCLFPNTDLPVVTEQDFYTFYFSKGLTLEAEVLAKRLHPVQSAPDVKPILQVFREVEHSLVPANAFRAALQRYGVDHLQERRIPDNAPLTAAAWKDLLQQTKPATVVLWLADPDLTELAKGLDLASTPIPIIYLSGNLLTVSPPSVPEALKNKIYLVYPFDLPTARQRHLFPIKAWLRSKQIPFGQPRVQANAYFAVTLTSRALRHLLDNFSREYFAERIEHLVDNASTSSVYPHVSLGPDQRFASKGSYIVKVDAEATDGVYAVSDWIVP